MSLSKRLHLFTVSKGFAVMVVAGMLAASCAPAAAPAPSTPQPSAPAPAAAPTRAPSAPAPTAAPAATPTPAPRAPAATPASTSGQPKRGGTLHLISSTDAPHWDPQRETGINAMWIYLSEFLVDFNDDGTAKPQLAESWEF
ncbi:MAG: hypothetical protein Q7T26_13170, partial [Dehalococcoidia bacterium]|nr:hypothetical protein [Dehalococcoidia bacterium]